jgi:hypothetical protein
VERECRDCGVVLPEQGRSRPRERCESCAKERRRVQKRDHERKTHPGWEERRAAANERQRDYRKGRPQPRSGQGLAEAYASIVPEIDPDDPARTPEKLLAILAADQAKGDALEEEIRVSDALPVSSNRKRIEIEEILYEPGPMEVLEGPEGEKKRRTYAKALDPGVPEVKRIAKVRETDARPGTKPLWQTLLSPDPLSPWASNPIEELYAYGPLGAREVDIFEGMRTPGHYRSQGFAAVQAASGAALLELAKARRGTAAMYGPNAREARVLIHYVTNQVKPWEEKTYGPVLRKIDSGEIRDENGRPIVKRTRPLGNPETLADAIVDLALNEREEP